MPSAAARLSQGVGAQGQQVISYSNSPFPGYITVPEYEIMSNFNTLPVRKEPHLLNACTYQPQLKHGSDKKNKKNTPGSHYPTSLKSQWIFPLRCVDN